MVNRFELLGHVSHSPEFLRTASGTPFCFLRMSTRRSTSGDGRNDYHFITLWSAAAQRAAESLKIGDPVFVDGRIEAGVSSRNDHMRASSIRFVAAHVVPVKGEPHGDSASHDSEPIGTFVEAPEHEVSS